MYEDVEIIANFSATNDIILVIFIGFLFTKYQKKRYKLFYYFILFNIYIVCVIIYFSEGQPPASPLYS